MRKLPGGACGRTPDVHQGSLIPQPFLFGTAYDFSQEQTISSPTWGAGRFGSLDPTPLARIVVTPSALRRLGTGLSVRLCGEEFPRVHPVFIRGSRHDGAVNQLFIPPYLHIRSLSECRPFGLLHVSMQRRLSHHLIFVRAGRFASLDATSLRSSRYTVLAEILVIHRRSCVFQHCS